MAIEVETVDADELLAGIMSAIDDGDVVTWLYDDDGDFTHATPQWHKRAWLVPEPSGEVLRLTILAPKDDTVSVELYAIYHGRFVEMLLAHFDDQIRGLRVSSLPEDGDDVGSSPND